MLHPWCDGELGCLFWSEEGPARACMLQKEKLPRNLCSDTQFDHLIDICKTGGMSFAGKYKRASSELTFRRDTPSLVVALS